MRLKVRAEATQYTFFLTHHGYTSFLTYHDDYLFVAVILLYDIIYYSMCIVWIAVTKSVMRHQYLMSKCHIQPPQCTFSLCTSCPLQEQGFQDARKLLGKRQKHNVSKGSSSIAHNLVGKFVGADQAAALDGREYTDAVSAAYVAQVPELC